MELEDFKDEKAARRETKKRPRMRVHGAALKKSSTRAVLRIAKLERGKKR